MYTKKISVLMGIYNCESTLCEAVEAIQKQTYTNWELIMCDDGSSDGTLHLAESLAKQDERIIVITNPQNCGLNITLNHCLSRATGDYIARMDGDDVCVPERFEKQISYLESQDEYAICSSAMFFFDESGIWGGNKVKEYPTANDIVKGSPICHAPVMMRKECMDAVHGYTEDVRMLRVEDVNLWIKLYTAGYRCHNLGEQLYGMRNDQNAFSRRKYRYRMNSTYVRLLGCKALGLSPKYYILSFKPMVIGLIPNWLRRIIRKRS